MFRAAVFLEEGIVSLDVLGGLARKVISRRLSWEPTTYKDNIKRKMCKRDLDYHRRRLVVEPNSILGIEIGVSSLHTCKNYVRTFNYAVIDKDFTDHLSAYCQVTK